MHSDTVSSEYSHSVAASDGRCWWFRRDADERAVVLPTGAHRHSSFATIRRPRSVCIATSWRHSCQVHWRSVLRSHTERVQQVTSFSIAWNASVEFAVPQLWGSPPMHQLSLEEEQARFCSCQTIISVIVFKVWGANYYVEHIFWKYHWHVELDTIHTATYHVIVGILLIVLNYCVKWKDEDRPNWREGSLCSIACFCLTVKVDTLSCNMKPQNMLQ